MVHSRQEGEVMLKSVQESWMSAVILHPPKNLRFPLSMRGDRHLVSQLGDEQTVVSATFSLLSSGDRMSSLRQPTSCFPIGRGDLGGPPVLQLVPMFCGAGAILPQWASRYGNMPCSHYKASVVCLARCLAPRASTSKHPVIRYLAPPAPTSKSTVIGTGPKLSPLTWDKREGCKCVCRSHPWTGGGSLWTYTSKWSTCAAPSPYTSSSFTSSREYRGTSRGFASRKSRANGASDPYGVLGLQRSASKTEIKRAYLAKAKELHPDVNPDQGAQQKFAEVNRAYQILSDDAKRQAFDSGGLDEYGDEEGMGDFEGWEDMEEFDLGNIFQMFEEMEGGGGRRSKREKKQKAPTIDMRVTFTEAALGCTKLVEVELSSMCAKCDGKGGVDARSCQSCKGSGMKITQSRGELYMHGECSSCKGKGMTFKSKCSSCGGKGETQATKQVQIKIPPGTFTGVRFIHRDRDFTARIAPIVDSHPFFKLNGADLCVSVPITVAMAMLGGKISVPTVTGTLVVTVEAGTQPGSQTVIRGKGVPKLDKDGKPASKQDGNLVVTWQVVFPANLTERQRQKMVEFGEEEEQPTTLWESEGREGE